MGCYTTANISFRDIDDPVDLLPWQQNESKLYSGLPQAQLNHLFVTKNNNSEKSFIFLFPQWWIKW